MLSVRSPINLNEGDLKEIVLVGHSYGGMIITGVADLLPDRIRPSCLLERVRSQQWRMSQ